MARQRKQMPQPPEQIEINFDADMEAGKAAAEMHDSRLVQIEVKGVKLAPPITVSPPVAAPGKPAPTPNVCPVRIVRDSEIWARKNEGIVELRVELDVESIVKEPAWGSVESAAAPPKKLPFVFHIGVQPEPTLPEKVTRDAELAVNFNAINWTWQGLTKDEKGQPVTDGDPIPNQAIEVPLDGSGLHGFKLVLELWKRMPNGTYDPAEADFTQYLSPDHKLSEKEMASVPEPWDDPQIRRIESEWWLKPLTLDNPLLKQEQIETTLRVHAYPEDSIKQHVPKKRPITQPPGQSPIALREIPLILSKAHWLVRVKEPRLDMFPFDFAHETQLKEGIPLVVEIFYLDRAGNKHFMAPGQKLQWEQRYSGAEHRPGKIIYQDAESDASGTFIVEKNGEVKFRYLPRDENLFFQPTLGIFYGDFDLYQQNSDGARGMKIRAEAHPKDETASSFTFDWAPFIELEGFKLPFHYHFEDSTWEGGRGDPSHRPKIPSEEEVRAIKIEIPDWNDYRRLFRNGGSFVLEPVFPHPLPGAEKVNPATSRGSPSSFGLSHCKWFFRKTVDQPKDGKRVAEVLPEEGSDPASATSGYGSGSGAPQQDGDAVATAPLVRHVIQVKPGKLKSDPPKDCVVMPAMPVHPNVALALIDIDRQAKETAAALAPLNSDGDSVNSLPGMVQTYTTQVCVYLARTSQEELIIRADSIISTLEAVADFLVATAKTCPDMVRAFDLHSSSFDRFKDNLINAFFDTIGLRKLMVPIQKMFGAAWQARSAALGAMGGSRLAQPLIDPSNVGRWAGETMEKALKRGGDFTQWSYSQLARGSLWLNARVPLARASHTVTEACEAAARRIADLTVKATESRQAFVQARNAMTSLAESVRSASSDVRRLRDKLVKLQTRAAEDGVVNLAAIEREIDTVAGELTSKIATLAGHLDEAPRTNSAMMDAMASFVDHECAKRAEEFGHGVLDNANKTLSQQLRVVEEALDGRTLDEKALHALEANCKNLDTLGVGAKQVEERMAQIVDKMEHNLRGPTQNQIDQLQRSMTAAIDGATSAVEPLEALGTVTRPSLQTALNIKERIGQAASQSRSALEANLDRVEGVFAVQSQSNLRRSINLIDGTLASVFEIFKDGCKGDGIKHHESLNSFLQSAQDPANAPPAVDDSQWYAPIVTFWQSIPQYLGAALKTIGEMPGWLENYFQKKKIESESWGFLAWFAFNVCKACVDAGLWVCRNVIGTIVNIVVFVVQSICKTIYYLLGKYADLLIYLCTFPDCIPKILSGSRLTSPAHDRADSVLTRLGLRDAKLFGFKFDQELYIVNELKAQAAAAGSGEISAASAAIIDLKRYKDPGYAHYYPGLRKAGYRIYLGLCAQAMAPAHLRRTTAAPTDLQYIHRGQAAGVALRQEIDRYADAFADVKADDQQFGTSIATAYYKADFRNGVLVDVNWKLVDTMLDWMAWTFAWTCRCIVLFAALICGLPFAAAAAALEAGDISDMIFGFLKVLVTLLGVYPRVLVFPLDLARTHALTYDMAFGPDDRFKADSLKEIVDL